MTVTVVPSPTLAVTSEAAYIEAHSPAERAGLQRGDIIVGFKGRPIRNIDDLHKKLVAAEIGVPSPVMVLRQTEKVYAMVVPEELKRPLP